MNDQSTPPAEDVRGALVKHQWHLTRWGDGRGGFAWRCSCGVMDWGTAAENPERYQRFPTENDAARAAVAHIAAEVRPRGTVTDAERSAINVALIRGLPLWVSAMEEGHARKALLDGIIEALEAAREARQ